MDASDRLPPDLERETRALRRVARGVLFEPALAEDAVQEAWLAALRAPADGPRTGGWLTEAVRRIARGMRREQSRRAQREHEAARREAQPSAADSAARVELLRGLLDALEALEEPYRTALQLRLVDDLPPRAIARRLGVPVETARTRVKRGIEKLRAQLDARNAARRGEFLAALLPLALPSGWKLGVGAYAGSKAILGGVMSAQVKLASAAAVLLLVAGLFWTHPWSASEPEAEHAQAPAQPVSANAVAESTASAEVETPATTAAAAATDRRVLGSDAAAWIVRGRTTTDRGQPFPGAELQFELVAGYEGEGDVLRTQSLHADETGHFALTLPQPDHAVRLRVRGKMPGYLSYRHERLVLRGAEAPQDLLIGFQVLDLRLAGRVVDLQGAPIAGAHVDGPGPDVVETDAEGKFDIPGSSLQRSARIDAWADGFAEERTRVSVAAPGRIENIEIRLTPSLEQQGRVVNEAGLGIADAEVRCFPLGRVRTRTARDGSFTLKGLPSTPTWLSIAASAPGYATQREELREGRVRPEGLVLTLARGVEISGQVVDEAGQPLPGAELYTGSSSYDIDALHAVAGDEGRFVIRDAPRATRELHAERSGYAPAERALAIPGRGLLAPLRIELGHGLALSGIAVDAQAKPIAGLRVSVLREHEYVEGIEATSGEDGRFAVANLPRQGALEIELYGQGFVRRSLAVDPASGREVRIVMERAAGLAGRVVDAASGKPVTSFRVRLLPGEALAGEALLGGYESSWAEQGREFQDPDGRWSTQGEELAPGQVAGIEIRASGYAPAFVAHALTTANPDANPIETALGAGASLRGRVVDKRAGTPIAGARVRRIAERDGRGAWMSLGQGARDAALTDASGSFLFEGLAPGRFSLAVDAPGFAPLLDGPFELDAGTPERSLELVPGASLRGILRDGEGRAQPHAAISVLASGGAMGGLWREWTLESDAEGRFELGDLMPAQYAVSQDLRAEGAFVRDLTLQVVIGEARAYEVELRPRGNCSLSGTIEIHGAPAPLLTIQAWPAGGDASVARGTFARDGHFTLEGLEPGHWRIQVWEPGSSQHARQASAEVDVGAGSATTLTIELQER